MSTEKLLETDVSDGVALLRMRDARRRNALSTSLVSQLLEQTRRTDVSAFILTGSEGFFSAGADVASLLSGEWAGPRPSGPPLMFRSITEDPRPWIAAINGPALGGGCELALSCDLVLMAGDAYLKLPEASLGVVPNTAARLLSTTLPHAVAMQFLLGLTRLPADRAIELGLATSSHPAGELEAAAIELAHRIRATVAPGAFGLIKQTLRTRPDDFWEAVAGLLAHTDPTEVRAGIEAMQERRRHDYTTSWTSHHDERAEP